jgi:phenylacetate-CoA ligase
MAISLDEPVRTAQAALRALRGRVYDLHWDLRARLVPFDLKDGIRLLAETERWPRARLDQMRDQKLRGLVAHAYATIPGYRDMMDQRGVKPSDIQGIADLPRLPVMTKDILRERTLELRATDIPQASLENGMTGGTTGVPMRVVRDRQGTVWQRASYWRGFAWGGLTLDRPWVQLFGGSMGYGGRRMNRLKNWFAGKVFLSAFELGPHNVGEYVEAIRGADAQFLVGYASACYQLATFVERHGLSLSLKAVFPTAELLPPQWAETIARVFGAQVLPYYGCGEVQSLGYSCPDATDGTLHTCDEHAVLEVERADGTVGLEGEGAFLTTDLDNRAMPLIRYRNGDAGVLAAPGCVCGRSLGRIMRLDGRINDVLITTAGAAISGVLCTHTFRLINDVDAYQVIQRRSGHVIVRIVRAAKFNPAVEEPKVRDIFSKYLGRDAEIVIEYVSSVAKTPAGKARFVINEFLANGGVASGGVAGTPPPPHQQRPSAEDER